MVVVVEVVTTGDTVLGVADAVLRISMGLAVIDRVSMEADEDGRAAAPPPSYSLSTSRMLVKASWTNERRIDLLWRSALFCFCFRVDFFLTYRARIAVPLLLLCEEEGEAATAAVEDGDSVPKTTARGVPFEDKTDGEEEAETVPYGVVGTPPLPGVEVMFRWSSAPMVELVVPDEVVGVLGDFHLSLSSS